MRLLARLLVIGLLPVFLILTNVRLVMSHTFARWEYARPGFPPAPTISDAERAATALAAIDFVRGQASEAEFRALRVNGQPAWNAREVQHMVDVRNVTAGAFLAHVVVGVVLLAALLALRGRRAARALLGGSLATVVGLVLLGVFAALSFSRFFTLFHRLFFEGETWIFNNEDTLIQLFPLPFWFDATLLIVGLTLAEALVVALLAARLGSGARDGRLEVKPVRFR